MPNASKEAFRAAREPTGPRGISLFQRVRGPALDPLERWTKMREEHGDVARYRYGLSDSYLISSAEGAKRVLVDNLANYTKKHLSYWMIRQVVGNGLLTSEGSFWLRQRRLAQPAFHRERLAAMGAQMVTAAEDTARRWEDVAARGETVSMFREMSALTLRVVGEALFGVALSPQAARVGQAWDVLNQQLVERFTRLRFLPPVLPTQYDRDFRRAKRTMLEVVDKVIALRRGKAEQGHDLLSMLMAARDEDTGEQMTDGQLRDEVTTLVLAGSETTAAALSWTWALLASHPHEAATLRAELSRVLGGRSPATADLPQLVHTRRVLDEAMRLYPPAYILFRRVVADDVVAGHRVHRGGVVIAPPLVFHRHPAYWPRPEAFLPGRWADTEAEARRPRFAYLPFSGGPRQCIGNNFALLEATLLLATLAQRFRPTLADGYTLAPEYLVTLRPRQGLPMRLHAA